MLLGRKSELVEFAPTRHQLCRLIRSARLVAAAGASCSLASHDREIVDNLRLQRRMAVLN